ncbi:PAS domain S-box protein [Desulfobulbus alkaliphilus]|uniref:PAS domain S-box protein n=1 Tax=Desulfobulbus alkaliphilus TaxID=869814 RepID=UPI0019642ED0|nr:PAS domain S-box protein [Desulfobulbus alkaliphilus]MBM9537903.1 PAS domain S-box protein [Desulfobulbus alkaliphilus]
MHEPIPTYEELKHRLASAEASLQALRQGQREALTAEHRALLRRLAEAEARSEHFQQVLEAVRAVNHLIISEEDPLRLITGACRLLTEKMGYLNAWIALWDHETGEVVATADAGFGEGFTVLGERLQAGQYPDCVRGAFDHGDLVIVKDPVIECRQCPLAPEYRGRAGLSRRLHYDGRIHGVLSVSVPTAYVLDGMEQALFRELATNLSFALHKIETDRIRCGHEGFYTSLFENNHAVILLIDPEDGGIVDANPAAERFYGWSRETLKGMHISAINTLPPVEIRDRIRVALESRRNHFHFTHRRADGTECDVEVYAGAIEIKGRALLYSFIHDISKRKQAEEALREKTLQLQEAIRATNVGLWDWDLVTNKVHFSAEWKRQIGYQDHEIQDDFTEWECRVHPDDLGSTLTMVQDAIAVGNRDYRVEFRFRHKDGSYRWILALGSVLTDDSGRAIRALGSHIDITERKCMEQALRESEERYRLLADVTMEGILIHKDGVAIDLNASLTRMFGLPRHELLNINFITFVHQEDLPLVHRNMAKEYAPPYTIRIVKPDGDVFFAEIESRNYRQQDDLWRVSAVRDVTARKHMEDALRESEARSKALLQAIPDMMFVFDRDGLFLDYHASDCSNLLLPPEQFIGRTVYEVLPPDIADLTLAHIRDILANGKTPTYWYAIEQEGAVRNYESRMVVCGENKFLAIVRDITEQRQAEEELRQRENQLQRIFEILPIGLWFADKDGTLLRGNPKGIEIWGAEPKVPLSEYGVFKAWRLPDREPVEADQWALAKTIRTGETIVDELLEIETFDGKRKTILNYTAPVLDGDDRIAGAIVVNLDISDRKALEDQLLQAQKMESIGRLAGGVAHDFNNMLGVILGYAEMLLGQVSAGQRMYKAVHGIQQAAQRSADLTRQLLAFARKQNVTPQVLDLNETVAGMLLMLRRLIGEDIKLSWMPGRDLWAVRMDPSQIDQILANLCVNARDAIGGTTGRVTIETANVVFDQAYCALHAGFVPGEYILLAVSDDGCGMDKETLSHLFEPFYTTKEVGQGTGLGSAMVYGIIRQNNGFINVYSEPGQGTTFRMYLPRFAVQGTDKTEAETLKPMACGQETILLVEDEPMILEMVSLMLESQGYTVLAAATPGEALRLAREYSGIIHLLMTDVIMPEMNGRELAQNLLTLHPGLKRLFMSGYTANVIAHHGVLDADVHFIQKPFSNQDLAAKVRIALEDDI